MTDRYAVVGNPVAHSLSPAIHAEFARQTGQNLEYARLLCGMDQFTATVSRFRDSGGQGLNVTVPFKREAFALAVRISERARHAGAVNTLSFDGGRIAGDNTDGIGLVRDLRDNLGFEISGRRILIVGAGGAARGIVPALLHEHPRAMVIANRTVANAEALVAECATTTCPVIACGLEDLAQTRFDLVINATSSSLSGGGLALIDSVFEPDALAYDLMYGKGLTPFLGFAQHHGARVADGLGMLVEQAAESFFVWRGVRPETRSVIGVISGRFSSEVPPKPSLKNRIL